MKLPAILRKAGVASAGAGIYLYFRKLFRSNRKTKKGTAKNLKQTKAFKKPITKPRQKRSAAIEK
jgi:hypothetical protein